MSRIAPRISAVVVTRNDGYGADQEKRFVFSMNAMLRLYEEIVIVDWNSPTQETLLDTCKPFIDRTGKILEIVVTDDDIKDLGYPTHIPISEVHGRNIGIRRCSSEYILSTNPDIVPINPFGYEIPENKMVTSPRCDTWNFKFFSIHESDTFIESATRESKYWESKPRIPDHAPDKWSKIVCCGDFQLAHRALWDSIRGFEEGMMYRSFADTNVQKKTCIYGDGVDVLDYRIVHLNHSGHDMKVGKQTFLNDEHEWIYRFTETKNTLNWGVPTYQFKTRRW